MFNEAILEVPIPLIGVAVTTPPPEDLDSRPDIPSSGTREQRQQTLPIPLIEAAVTTPPPDDPGSRQDILSSGTPKQERQTRRASRRRVREGTWEFGEATPVVDSDSDGLPRFEVQWHPVWVHPGGINTLGPRAAKTFRRLLENDAGSSRPLIGGGDEGWTQMPKDYRFSYPWDAEVIKLRQVNGLTQGLVQWPPSVVCWNDLTEDTMKQLGTLL